MRTSVQPFSSFALRCCLLLLQLCLLFNHLRSSAFSPFSSGFCHICNFHTSLSPIFHTSLSPYFFINSCAFSYCLSFLLPDEASGRNVGNSTVCFSTLSCSLNYYTSILFVLHKSRNFLSVAHFGAAILVFSACFFLSTHALSLTVFHISYLMKLLGETSLILLSVVLPFLAL